MLSFLADENFNRHIVRTLRRHHSDLDVVRVQEMGLSGSDDVALLAWAAESGRLLLTHDVTTVTKYGYQRVAAGLAMPGVVEVPRWLPIPSAAEQILMLAECSREGEWEGQVLYLPL